MDVNLNNTACIVTKNHIGYDTFVNICTGRSVDVSWTGFEWAGIVFATVFCATILLFFAFMIWDSGRY